jgi:hypothetical protein
MITRFEAYGLILTDHMVPSVPSFKSAFELFFGTLNLQHENA